jgi:hypothetical protein
MLTRISLVTILKIGDEEEEFVNVRVNVDTE